MAQGIQQFEVTEGNLKAVKDTSGFGNPNMWNLYIKTIKGCWENIQWVPHYTASKFFTSNLPYYNEENKSIN